jgi:phosphoserine aminotransferase
LAAATLTYWSPRRAKFVSIEPDDVRQLIRSLDYVLEHQSA